MSTAKGFKAGDLLEQLECLFTWSVDKQDINDLKGVPEKLQDRINYCPRKYHSTYNNILAFVSHLLGDTGTAIECLQRSEDVLKAEKRNSVDFLVTYSSLAWLHSHLGNQEDTKAYLQKVTNAKQGQDSNDVSAAVESEKGWSFLRLGAKFYPRAEESFQKALEVQPDDVGHNVGYAVVLYRQAELVRQDVRERPEDSLAVRQLQRALVLDPDDAEVMVLLALKLQQFNRGRARELIRKALATSADIPQVTRYAGTFFRRGSDHERSLELLQEAVERAPNSSFLYHQMGLCHWHHMVELKSQGHRRGSAEVADAVAKSLRLFRKTVQLKPSNTFAWVHLAEAMSESGQLRQAEPIFTRLVADKNLTDSERQHSHAKYGDFLMYHKKDDAKAVEQFKLACLIHIESRDYTQAQKRLRQIAKNRYGKMADDIHSFLRALNQQQRVSQNKGAGASVRGLDNCFKTMSI